MFVSSVLSCGAHCAEVADPTAGMSERQKKLYELQQRLKASRKANQTAVMAERKRKQVPKSIGICIIQ